MVYECAVLADKMEDAKKRGDSVEEKRIDERLAFLTPILKGYLTEMGVEAANTGIQVRRLLRQLSAPPQHSLPRSSPAPPPPPPPSPAAAAVTPPVSRSA